ncbi:hypothetical protein KFU94_57830 [Chloroflexi bacterium TSY]|nr:hypothetical protein [Chloroflexi bacterium TSY]
MLRAAMVAGAIGLLVEAAFRWQGGSTPPGSVYGLLAVTGIFQGLYFLGLTRGYAIGAFAVVYPVARGLPVLFLALVDIARGRPPSVAGWIGMILVVAGCLLAPLDSVRTVRRRHYLNMPILWIGVTALGTVGYTTVDKLAAEQVAAGGFVTAARYGLLQAFSTSVYLLLLLFGGIKTPLFGPHARSLWRRAALTSVVIFSGYWLILWAYQLTLYASYIVALRQFSIVLGVVVSMLYLHEHTPRVRLVAAFCITAGCMAIVVGA